MLSLVLVPPLPYPMMKITCSQPSSEVIVDPKTIDALEDPDYIHDDIECLNLEDSYVEDNGVADYCDLCNVEFGKLVPEDLYDHVVYGELVKGDDVSSDDDDIVENQHQKNYDPKYYERQGRWYPKVVPLELGSKRL